MATGEVDVGEGDGDEAGLSNSDETGEHTGKGGVSWLQVGESWQDEETTDDGESVVAGVDTWEGV